MFCRAGWRFPFFRPSVNTGTDVMDEYDHYVICELVAGAYAAWDAHLGSHFCPDAAGTGACETGSEILRRLHTAVSLLDRKRALGAVRAWDWEPDAPYENEGAA